MPICENSKNNSKIDASPLPLQADIEIANVQKSIDQAYFNSYAFDAIEKEHFHNGEKIVIECDSVLDKSRQSTHSGLDLGTISNAYLKRLTSYFTLPSSKPISNLTTNSESQLFEASEENRISDLSNSSSSSSAGSSKTLCGRGLTSTPTSTLTIIAAPSTNKVNSKAINNFLLPRAMLKYQSGTTTTQLASGAASLSSMETPVPVVTISKVNSIPCTINRRAVNVNSNPVPGNVLLCNGRERNNNLVSHYSTEKNGGGSSGYYSSNLCSTSSVEEHIYSEPVSDMVESAVVVPTAQTLMKKSSGTTITTTSPLQPSPANLRIQPDNKIFGESHANIGFKTAVDSNTINKTNGGTVSRLKIKQDLRTLETSIENLDRHLKRYPKNIANSSVNINTLPPPPPSPQIASHLRSNSFTACMDDICLQEFEKSVNNRRYLPTIMEGRSPVKTDIDDDNTETNDANQRWSDELDDSLRDIDFDSFLLANELTKLKKTHTTAAIRRDGIDNPTFIKSEILNDEKTLENNYKCSKYVNSCPEDAYKVESMIECDVSDCQVDNRSGSCELPDKSLAYFLKKYEDHVHFQSTKDMLEDIRERLRLLTQAENETTTQVNDRRSLPSDLEKNITTLKADLESYLRVMSYNSEMEIKQFCAGVTKNQKLVTMTKAFERRKSLASCSSDINYEIEYELVQGRAPSIRISAEAGNHSVGTDLEIQSSSDPNFKMRRKSFSEMLPSIMKGTTCCDQCYTPLTNLGTTRSIGSSTIGKSILNATNQTQLQKNLSFQKPTLQRDELKVKNDKKNSVLEWHKNKPSIWEMYYGTNRLNQTLTGKRGQMVKNTTSIMSYPSSRPESDFTLDLPRAEQLRLKMEKEKKFRHRCRILTTFLSLIFFLLTVMIVSLILTRGKRMFGSML